ncbi:hypothetical protein [Alistipes senegalensis]|uniref:hypothetical protein n=1 Tax=Alistipes senegalensis TaxID=1288121 RepID=UPI00248E8076|nr:hypothetical protein [Alistipes senegalensis]
MKIKNYLALTLMAAVSFAACDKGENGADGDKSPKSVTLTLSNVVPGTRAADDPVAGDSKVTLNDFQVFFAESDGTLVKGKTLQNTDAEHYFAVADFKDENKVFHFLPAEVTKVIVVGNLSEDLKTALASAGSTDDLKRTLTVAAEQDDANLALYDEVELTTVVGEDSAGHPLYKAAMVLEPRVARIEVVGFEYKAEVDGATQAEKERLYESIQVEQIVLNNYYGQAEFVTGAVSGAKTNTTIDAGSVFGFFANAASDWTNDKLDGTNLPAVNLDEAAGYKMAYGAAAKRPAYHFFPDAAKIAGDDHPQLVVKLTGTKANGDKAALYLATKGFSPAVTSDVAKIYQVKFEFDDGDLANPQKCVEVSVDVVAWDVVPVIAQL